MDESDRIFNGGSTLFWNDVDAQDFTREVLVGDLDTDVVLILGSINSVGLVASGAARDLEGHAAGIPRLTLANLIDMELGRRINGRINLNNCSEVTLAESLIQDGALRVLNVGTRESSHLELMQGVVILVKALGAIA